MLEIKHSIELLKTYKIPFSASEGILYLEQFKQQLALMILYQQMFPDRWASSTTPMFQHSHPGVYSDREIEFLERVNENLFPLDWLEDFESCQERYFDVPICSVNIDWQEHYIEELDYGLRFLLSLRGDGYAKEDWSEHFGFTPSVLFDGYEIDWDRLEVLSQSAIEPLSYLYDVASIIDHSTGCIWLDWTDEMYEPLPWEQEILVTLAQQWKEAQKYLSKLQQFERWIELSPDNRKQALDLWNQAYDLQRAQHYQQSM